MSDKWVTETSTWLAERKQWGHATDQSEQVSYQAIWRTNNNGMWWLVVEKINKICIKYKIKKRYINIENN